LANGPPSRGCPRYPVGDDAYARPRARPQG
jgi:hypothetical protein